MTPKERIVLQALKGRGRFFNELCRMLKNRLSRKSIVRALITLEHRGLVKSALKESAFDMHGDGSLRWVRVYEIGRLLSKD